MDDSLAAARAQMIATRFGGNSKGAATGGSGSVRRKNKGPIKAVGDDKKLGGILKKIGLQPLNNFEEVNIFKNDGEVIHITSPKIQASTPSNTYVVTGVIETKMVTEMLPSILNQLGPESMDRLRKYAETMGTGHSNQSSTIEEEEEEEEDDDEVPDLVENFEDAAAK